MVGWRGSEAIKNCWGQGFKLRMERKSTEDGEQHDVVRKLLEILSDGIRIKSSGFKFQLAEHFGKSVFSASVSSCRKGNCDTCSTCQTGCEEGGKEKKEEREGERKRKGEERGSRKGEGERIIMRIVMELPNPLVPFFLELLTAKERE